jgi:hypothetical protein
MAMRTSSPHRQAETDFPARKTRTKKNAIQHMEECGARIEDFDFAAIAAMPGIDIAGDFDWLAAHYGFVPRSALHAARYAIHDFDNACARALRSCPLSEENDRAIAIALGQKGMTERLLLANKKIRFEATRIFQKVLFDYWRQTRSPGRKWFFVTFMGDEGNTLEYHPGWRVKPFRGSGYKMLHQEGLNAVGVIEIQPLTNFPGRGYGGTQMVNGHAIAWTDDPSFDHEAVEERLRNSRRLSHWLGWPTVSFTPIEEIAAENRQSIYDDPAWQIRWRAYYLFKAPYVGKYLARSNTPGRDWDVRKTTIRPYQALRLVEGLSQLEFPEVVFGVHGGTELSRLWKSRLSDWHKKQLRRPCNRRSILPRDADVASLWHPTRRSNKRVERQPYVFHTTAEKRPLQWSATAAAAMIVLNDASSSVERRP